MTGHPVIDTVDAGHVRRSAADKANPDLLVCRSCLVPWPCPPIEEARADQRRRLLAAR